MKTWRLLPRWSFNRRLSVRHEKKPDIVARGAVANSFRANPLYKPVIGSNTLSV
jgi:hypothetical protein